MDDAMAKLLSLNLIRDDSFEGKTFKSSRQLFHALYGVTRAVHVMPVGLLSSHSTATGVPSNVVGTRVCRCKKSKPMKQSFLAISIYLGVLIDQSEEAVSLFCSQAEDLYKHPRSSGLCEW